MILFFSIPSLKFKCEFSSNEKGNECTADEEITATFTYDHFLESKGVSG